MRKKALIYSFIGRENFGDELMLRLHRELLENLGYVVYFTTNYMYFPNIPNDYFFKDRLLLNHNNSDFDLILFGGGALPIHFGAELLMRYKTNKPNCKIIASCINEFIHGDENYKNFVLNFYNTFFDGIIFRSKSNEEFKDKIKTPNIFLPDITTCLNYKNNKNENKIAIVIRDEVLHKDLKIALPQEDSEILIMSRTDQRVSDIIQKITDIPIIEIFKKDPKEQYEILRSYNKVLSIGRFHAAICNKNYPENTCYLYPFIQDSTPIITNSLYNSWEDLKKIEQQQINADSEKKLYSKTGTLMSEFYNYPSCKKEDYESFIKSII